MKRIKEWAELCSDDTIRQQWIDNANAQDFRGWEYNRIQEDMHNALFRSFSWGKSPQGFRYWIGIYDDMERNPDKYLKKRKAMFHEYEKN